MEVRAEVNSLQSSLKEMTNLIAFETPNNFLIGHSDPCKVCGEPSSGWHCGAVTCEACKVRPIESYLLLLFGAMSDELN